MSNRTTDVDSAGLVASENRWLFIALGVLLILFGLAAVAFPLATTIAAKVLFGWIFLIGGVAQIVQSVSTRRWSGFFWSLLIGLLYLVAGGWLAFFPLTGLITLTVFLAAMFAFQGNMEIAMGLSLRPVSGWILVLISGAVSLLVGGLIVAQLPSSAAWAIGLLVGINMIASGIAYVSLALAAGKGVEDI